MFKHDLIPHIGVYTRWEIRFLRDIVREALLLYNCLPDGPRARRIARAIFDAFSRGEEDRTVLLRIGASGHRTTEGKRHDLMPPLARPTDGTGITWH